VASHVTHLYTVYTTVGYRESVYKIGVILLSPRIIKMELK